MPTVTITADYDGFAENRSVGGLVDYVKYDDLDSAYVGYYSFKSDWNKDRAFFRFPLTDLPSGVTVTQVRLKVYCRLPGGASHLLDVHGYNVNGQTDPQPDGAQNCYNRCASGNLYYDDGTDLRTTGEKWITLGETVCEDVQNAKSAVNRFSVGLHEEGDNDPHPTIDTLEKSGGTPAQLEITYEEAVPPAGYSYLDGLVCVQVAG